MYLHDGPAYVHYQIMLDFVPFKDLTKLAVVNICLFIFLQSVCFSTTLPARRPCLQTLSDFTIYNCLLTNKTRIWTLFGEF